MEIREKKIERVEYVKEYVANDGEVFQSEEECRKYEQTAKGAINGMFMKLPNIQINECAADTDPFYTFSCEDTIYAIRIQNVEELEVVNKWIKATDPCCCHSVSTEDIGKIILLCRYYDGVFVVGTPDYLKDQYCAAIDHWFSKLVENPEEGKGENA